MPSSIRTNIVSGDRVILAPERARRPRDHKLVPPDTSHAAENCPFCPTEPTRIPEPIRTRKSASFPDHEHAITVVPNLYPALTPADAEQAFARGPYDAFGGVGAHEVIIEAPEHIEHWTDLDARHIAEIFATWQERLCDLRNDQRLKDIIPFKNIGPRSGATLAHAHSQIIALPLVSPRQHQLLQRGEHYFELHHRCALCDALHHEEQSGERIILEDDAMLAWAPFASRSPFEVWIAPRTHSADFAHASHRDLTSLARHTRRILQLWEQAIGRVGHNLVLHSAPFAFADKAYYHWHLEMLPRLSTHGGFEWGSGAYINATASEVAARHLRELNS
ncbi:DUF4931 domain-containing protein [Bradymonadaceae bacterium TMQ3]|nr:DUF4931 domain-containing protein [Bradymonadaceae bacterium TMQ3]TXC78180.1 DUF4931 domain-containing protein [Bradymonadales bacterium TMQ1]